MPTRLSQTHEDYQSITPVEDSPTAAESGYHRLAFAVIATALEDLADSAKQADLGYAVQAAKRLRESQVFQFWCEGVLSLDACELIDGTMKRVLVGERLRLPRPGYETYGTTDGNTEEEVA
jgi:hypothetical protein